MINKIVWYTTAILMLAVTFALAVLVVYGVFHYILTGQEIGNPWGHR